MTYREYINVCRYTYLKAALKAANGNVTRAAKACGLNRTHMHRLVVELGLAPKGGSRHYGRWPK